jgi:hypothetical protein
MEDASLSDEIQEDQTTPRLLDEVHLERTSKMI